MKKHHFIALLLILFSFNSIFAENGSEKDKPYNLNDVVIITDKYTKDTAVLRVLAIPEEIAFESREGLENYLDAKKHLLINLRIFDDVKYSLMVTGEIENVKNYTATFTINGAWSLYGIPYAKYDSNTGFRMGAKVYNDNLLGSLLKFYLGASFDIRPQGDSFTIPQWTINPEISNFMLLGNSYSLSFTQQYVEESKYDSDINEYEELYNYYKTAVSLSSQFSLLESFYYSFSPSISFYYGYEDQLEDYGSNIVEEDIDFTFSHSIGRSDTDWLGNFRKGLSFALSQNLTYITENQLDGQFESALWGTVTGFYPIGIFNPSFRLRGVYSFNDELSSLGSQLRGGRNDSLYGIYGGFLNTSVNISVINWEGVGEALFQPFFDIGFAQQEGDSFSIEDDLTYTTGADFILYLDILKSLVARGTFGIDLTNPDWSDFSKYEIMIESTLFY